MSRFLLLISLFFTVQVCAASNENISHLKGIRSLYMYVDTSMATSVQPSERLDLNDIMELQLRRGAIDLNAYVLNQPEVNFPQVELLIDTSSRIAAGEFHLTLRVRDFVTIDRNGESTVATIFEMQRLGASGMDSKQTEAIKAQLRDLMAEFVTFFHEANLDVR